jgi:oleandomycin transport system ATP-binding protein
MSTSFAIEAEDLHKRYGESEALAGVDLAVATGSVCGLLGPNGAGKTTAVRILTTLSTPTSGRARVAGFDVVAKPSEVRRRIGLAAQDATVDGLLTGLENLVMIGELHHLGRATAKRRGRQLLEQFSLGDTGPKLVKEYSGGMRRRLDLAATLVAGPGVLFLDEPTTGLDPRGRNELWAVLDTLVDGGTTILLTTQYLEEADALANEITVIDHGKIIAHDTPQGLKRQTGGQTLDVRASSNDDLPRIRELLVKYGTREPEQPAPDQLSVPVADESALTHVVAALATEKISVAELSLRLPSLDEVFYSLTGTTKRDEARDDEPTTTKGAAA